MLLQIVWDGTAMVWHVVNTCEERQELLQKEFYKLVKCP